MSDEAKAPRLRDLGEERTSAIGEPDFGPVGDVGELPYASDDEGDDATPSRRTPLIVGLVIAVLLVVAIVVALVI